MSKSSPMSPTSHPVLSPLKIPAVTALLALAAPAAPVEASTSAFPARPVVARALLPAPPAHARAEARFRIPEKENGTDRAWVELASTWEVMQSERHTEHQANPWGIPGLRYDAGAGAIVYRHGDRDVVCARTAERGFLFMKAREIEPTGLCELRITRTVEGAPLRTAPHPVTGETQPLVEVSLQVRGET